MEILSVGVAQIDNNVFQIIGKADSDHDIVKKILLNKVLFFIEKAEKNHGIPQPNEVVHTTPTKVMIHATFMFLSVSDIEMFLKECKDINK